MPINDPAPPPKATERIAKTAARHIELIIFISGAIFGVVLTLVGGLLT